MATVLISKQFLSDVDDHINKMRDDELKFKGLTDCTSLELPPHIMPKFLEMIAWGEHLHLRDKMPQEWVKPQENRMDLVVKPSNDVRATLTVEFKPGNAVMPPLYSRYHDHEVPLHVLFDKNVYCGYPDYQYVADAFEKSISRVEIFKKWNNTLDQVKKFFAACPSVNKALTLQPSMMVYVPKQYINKVEAQVERKKREIPEIDAAALASQAVEMQIARSIHGGA